MSAKKTTTPLTHARLREVLDYNQDSGEFRWLVRTYGRHGIIEVGDIAGFKSVHNIYFKIGIDGNRYLLHLVAWFHVYGVWPPNFIDHIDRDPTNNRIANLRLATKALNNQNKRTYKNNKSGFSGVSPAPGRLPWRSQINVDGIYMYLGRFATAELAYAAYLEVKMKYHQWYVPVSSNE